jgi:hypothetical protein
MLSPTIRNILIVPAVLLGAVLVRAQDFSYVVMELRGAKLIAQDDENTFLGTFENSYASNSIFNEYGSYGNKYSTKSIWNDYGEFGGQYSLYSPFNKFSSTPPMILKNGRIIGYLTTNKSMRGAINPGIIKAISDQF